MQPIRVFLLGDPTLFREAVQKLLEKEPTLLFVGAASGIGEALKLLKKVHPDVLLLILEISHSTELEILRKVASMHSKVRTILVASCIEKEQILEVLRLGAYGIARKETSSQLSFKSIDAVMSNVYWIDQESVVGLVETLYCSEQTSTHASVYGLTPREMEILSVIVEGYTNQDIAHRFRKSTPRPSNTICPASLKRWVLPIDWNWPYLSSIDICWPILPKMKTRITQIEADFIPNRESNPS
jgi:two-component system, NarL family, nitrate/nitrite response regulator NarL